MRCGPGPDFGQINVRYQSQNPSKVVPKTSSGSLGRERSLENPTNEHLRLASVVGTLLKLRLRRKNSRLSAKIQRNSGVLDGFWTLWDDSGAGGVDWVTLSGQEDSYDLFESIVGI